MKTRISRRAFTALALGSGALLAAGASPLRPRRVSNGFEWIELVEGKAWVTGNSSTGGNVLVVVSNGDAMIVDAKFAGISPLLRAEAEERAGAAITTLINTHHHGDHTGGNVAFTADTRVIAHAAAALRVSRQTDSYIRQFTNGDADMTRLAGDEKPRNTEVVLQQAMRRAESDAAKAFMPTQTIDRYPTTIRVGDLRVDLYHFGPGHTDNDVVVHIPDLNLLHAGDLHFNGLHPYFDPNGGVSAAGWIRSVSQARELCDAKTRVVAGHGPVSDRDGLGRQIHYLESIIENVGKAIGEGRSKEETAQMEWPFMEGLGFEQVRPRAIQAVYDELSR